MSLYVIIVFLEQFSKCIQCQYKSINNTKISKKKKVLAFSFVMLAMTAVFLIILTRLLSHFILNVAAFLLFLKAL